MTEAAPLVTSSDLYVEPVGERFKSCGRAGLLVEVRIADANDEEVPRGTEQGQPRRQLDLHGCVCASIGRDVDRPQASDMKERRVEIDFCAQRQAGTELPLLRRGVAIAGRRVGIGAPRLKTRGEREA